MKLIVDGYNMIFSLALLQDGDLEEAREKLLDMLSDYGRVKKHSIIVVFDGQKARSTGHATKKWVQAIYTSPPESADDRIAKLAEKMREAAFIVTSDNGLISRVSRFNSPFVKVDDFIGKLEQTHYLSIKGLEEGEETERMKKPKKGASHRLPKKIRKQKRNLDKL